MVAPGAWGIRLWRLGAIGAAAGLLWISAPRAPQLGDWEPTLEEARRVFPEASGLSALDRGGWEVSDGLGQRLGELWATWPDADDIVGYSGPTRVRVALDARGDVVDLRLVDSADTPEHVEDVRRNRRFWESLRGWRPTSPEPPKVEAVAGSTLTSLAIVESVRKRLGGRTGSLRFPRALTPEEAVAAGLAGCVRLDAEPGRVGWHRARDARGDTLGYLVRTSPQSDGVVGYAGPTDVLAVLTPDAATLRSVSIRDTYDTPDYVARVAEDPDYLPSLARRTPAEWSRIDLQAAGIEGVAGATQTSYAVAEGLRRRFATSAAEEGRAEDHRRGLATLALLAGALGLAFAPGRGKAWVRVTWQAVLVLGLGLWAGHLLSLAQLAGHARHPAELGSLALLAGVALLAPWASGRQVYCHQVCPHGAAQSLLARLPAPRLAVAPRADRLLRKIPALLLGAAFLGALAWPQLNLATLEPFDAWVMGGAALASAILAVLGLALAPFAPMAYCRYGCPTGALLAYIRTTGDERRLGRRDLVAAGLLAAGLLALALRPDGGETEPAGAAWEGKAFGTTWRVKVRGPVADRAELEREVAGIYAGTELALSHWRPESSTSRFNRTRSTEPQPIDGELAEVLGHALRLSEATAGAFDPTLGPLTQAWGYGPGSDSANAPSPQELARLRDRTGWRKLALDPTKPTLAKAHPGLELDLGALLQGHANLRVARLLRARGHRDFLLECGGELLACGAWTVGIEDPSEPGRLLRRVELRDAALATSALHRSARTLGDGRKVHHLIDPRTGEPRSGPVPRLACVRRAWNLPVDGWPTALMALPTDEALELARRQGLEALLVDTDGRVRATDPGVLPSR
jgi:NosR/NirI family transcriptional regulator, nitrous oxide reductase regulator